MSDLTWTPDTARLDSLELWERNPKRMSKARAERLLKSWRDLGQYQTLAVGPGGECYDGHQRIKALRAAGYAGSYEVAVRRASRPLTDTERERVIIESTVGTVGALNWDDLAAWDRMECYDSVIGPEKASVGTILRDDGFSTSWFGKNHNTPTYQYSKAGPFNQWPSGMGFQFHP